VHASEVTSAPEGHGFPVEELRVRYYERPYCELLVPLVVISAFSELVVWALDPGNLAPNVIVVAERRSD